MSLYSHIAEEISAMIREGAYKPGDLLPTEMELSKTYNVSRPTVRAAMQQLAVDGYIRRVKGSGTFVAKPKLEQSSVRFIESYNQEMKSKGLIPKTEVLELRRVAAPPVPAEKLGIAVGAPVIKLKRLRFARPDFDDLPVLLTTAYIPMETAPHLLELDLENVSLYDTLEEIGIQIHRVRREIEIKLLHGKTARLLAAEENSPAHFVTSTGFDGDGRIIEYAESFYPADRNKFIITLNR